MPEPFKLLIDAGAIARIAEGCARVAPGFDRARLLAAAPGLAPLELKDRVRHVAAALRAALPAAWPEAAAVLVAALPPPLPDDTEVSSGFWLWPVLQVVEDFGADDPQVSLPALREMTRRFSAEFAVRPLLERHPTEAWAAVDAWASDADPHVRRLASEGTRPRLPWGRQLRDAVADPSRGLAVIERLVDDPSAYVRRSVANHLGDVAKDHPAVAIATAARWLANRPDRLPLVRHGLRDRLKRGDADALAAVGTPPAHVDVRDLAARPAVAHSGDRVEITATLTARDACEVRVDVVWAWPGARGGWSSKTFRGGQRRLEAGASWPFRYALSLRPATTRPLRPGPQRVWLRILGVDTAPTSFELR